MKKSDLFKKVYTGLTEEDSITKGKLKKMIDSIFRYLEESLIDNEVVKISNFGTFRKVERKGRKGKNFKTGAPCDIPQRLTITFKVSKKVVHQNLESLKKN